MKKKKDKKIKNIENKFKISKTNKIKHLLTEGKGDRKKKVIEQLLNLCNSDFLQNNPT